MPTLPLYTPTEVADASHGVIAPGGYEWWHFDAENAAGDLRVVAGLHFGYVPNATYLRQYRRYRRRPTRVRPPVPADFACVSLAVYERNRVLASWLSPIPAAGCSAAKGRVEVRLGPNSLRADVSGDRLLTLEVNGARAELRFRPRFALVPVERHLLPKIPGGAEHRWIIADPLCDVEGEIHLPDCPTIRFTGRGFHDHSYGTAPLAMAVRRWIRGRMLLEDVAVVFQGVRPVGRTTGDIWRVLECDAAGCRESSQTNVPCERASEAPTVLESSRSFTRALYEVESRGRRGIAFCEELFPAGVAREG